MDVALIAPIALLRFTETHPIQMMLPASREPTYLAHYRRLAKTGEHYVMLDNGAWEKTPLLDGDLITTGWRFQVQEVVAPDIINEPRQTLLAMKDFFAKFYAFTETATGWHPSFVAVAHGDSMVKAMDFIRTVADTYPLVSTISAGRAFTRNCGDRYARAQLAEWVATNYPGRFWFHLLGYNDAWHGELVACRDTARSVDTVAPFTAAYHNTKLIGTTEWNAPRPAGYFNIPASRFDLRLVEDNIKQLLGEARG